MPALVNCARLGLLALVIVGFFGAGTAGIVLWQADAAQPEVRVWIRDGEAHCKFVPESEAIGAQPCQS